MPVYLRSQRRRAARRAAASVYGGADDISAPLSRPQPVPPPTPEERQSGAASVTDAELRENQTEDAAIDAEEKALASIETQQAALAANPLSALPGASAPAVYAASAGAAPGAQSGADAEIRKAVSHLERSLTAATDLATAYDANVGDRAAIVRNADQLAASQSSPLQLKELQQLSPLLLKRAGEWNRVRAALTADRERVTALESSPAFRADKFEKTRVRFVDALRDLRRVREGVEQELALVRVVVFDKMQTAPNTPDKLEILRAALNDLLADWGALQQLKSPTTLPPAELNRWIVNPAEWAQNGWDARVFNWPEPPNNTPLSLMFSQQAAQGTYYRFVELVQYRMHLEYLALNGFVQQIAPGVAALSAASAAAGLGGFAVAPGASLLGTGRPVLVLDAAEQSRLQSELDAARNELLRIAQAAAASSALGLGPGGAGALASTEEDLGFPERVTAEVRRLTENLAEIPFNGLRVESVATAPALLALTPAPLGAGLAFAATAAPVSPAVAGALAATAATAQRRIVQPLAARREFDYAQGERYRFRQVYAAPSVEYEQQLINYALAVPPPPVTALMTPGDVRRINREWLRPVDYRTLIALFRAVAQTAGAVAAYPSGVGAVLGGREKRNPKRERGRRSGRRVYANN